MRSYCPKKIAARTGYPASVFGGGLPGLDLVVACKPAKMIETHNINKFQYCAEPLQPPSIACLFVSIPAIKRIAPQLPRRREVVGRDASHNCGQTVFIEEEKLRVRPGIRAIVCNKDRDIANDLDVPFICICAQFVPLTKKKKLI